MKTNLKDEHSRQAVALLPAVLEEIRDNIRTLKNANESTVSPNTEEKKLIAANERYIETMSQILPFGEMIIRTMQRYGTEITDRSPILSVIDGFYFYASNRMNQKERVRKHFAREKFYYRDGSGKVVMSSLSDDGDSAAMDLSYANSNLYKDMRELQAHALAATKNSDSAKEWLIALAKTPEYKKLPNEEKIKIIDLVHNAQFTNEAPNIMNALNNDLAERLEKSNDIEEFQICQCLFAHYNKFLQRLYSDCWAAKIEYNL